MTLLILSFVAGVLTIAAPCILPLLPVVVGGSLVAGSEQKSTLGWRRPIVIVVSLGLSVIVFTLLLKATTALLDVPQAVWQILSGLIITVLGLYFLFPVLWEKTIGVRKFSLSSNKLLGSAGTKQGLLGAVLTGAALGPVFNSCSPTYALIVAAILPVSFAEGLVYLLAYAVGLGAVLLLVAYLGQAFALRLRWLSNPKGWLKRTVGIVFIVVGLSVIFGFDKALQTYVLERGWYDPISGIEEKLSP